jgi:hypothetical protein
LDNWSCKKEKGLGINSSRKPPNPKKMNETKLSIFDSLQSFLFHACEFGVKYRNRKEDFTRHRTYTFKITALLVLQMLKKSLPVELDAFFDSLGSAPGTKSGFSKARCKLKHLFFPRLDRLSG